MRTMFLASLFGLFVSSAALADDARLAYFQPPGPRDYYQVSDYEYCDDTSIFYAPLARYGEWVDHSRYGWVWLPWGIRPDWRPYMYGRWVWTEYGWTWDSFEPFGWAVYHYGRWTFDWRLGWIWIPDTIWGPAWVAWRGGAGWVGWSALPPDAAWGGGGFINLGFLTSSSMRRHGWNFVEDRRFAEDNLAPYIVRSSRNMYIYDETRDWTHYNMRDGRIFNRGADLNQLERRIGRPIERWSIREESSWERLGSNAAASGKAGGSPADRQLRMFRPKFSANATKDVKPKLSPVRPVTPGKMDPAAMRSAELQQLERRVAADRAEMLNRHRKELDRWLARGMPRNEIERRHKAEVSAFEEKIAREKAQLERTFEREQRGEFGFGNPGERRYRVESEPLGKPGR